jgi:hypothetical protein
LSDEPKRRGRPPKVREIAPEELREASNNRAEQGNAPTEPVAAPVAHSEPLAAPVVGLADWIASIERDTPPILVAVTHPDATERVYPGKYSGIRMSHGPVSAIWSDGSKT